MPLLSSIPVLSDAAETLRLLFIAIGLAGIAALLDSQLQKLSKPPAWVRYGIGFGAVALAAMQFPITGLFGLPVDLRAPVLAVAALVAGPKALLIAGGMLLAYRAGIGGSFTWIGVATIASAMLVALGAWALWFRSRRFSWRATIGLGLALAVANAFMGATPADPLNDVVIGYLILLSISYPASLLIMVFAISEMRLHRSLIENRRSMEGRLSEALSRAEAASRARARLLASASHDLRTPLNAIIGYTGAIKAGIWGPLSPPRYSGYIDNIDQAAEHLLHLVNQWIDVAHTTSDDWTAKPIPLTFRQILDDVTVTVMPQAASKGISLKAEAGADGTAMLLDRGAVRQIVTNLVGNAIKYTPAGGRVSVSTGWHDGWAIIRVRDTGPGLPDSVTGQLGVPFRRGENALPQPGWGLGLAIVSEITEKLGGRLSITNPPEGGALAIVELRAPRVPDGTGILAANDAGARLPRPATVDPPPRQATVDPTPRQASVDAPPTRLGDRDPGH